VNDVIERVWEIAIDVFCDEILNVTDVAVEIVIVVVLVIGNDETSGTLTGGVIGICVIGIYVIWNANVIDVWNETCENEIDESVTSIDCGDVLSPNPKLLILAVVLH